MTPARFTSGITPNDSWRHDVLDAEHQDFSEIDALNGLITPEVGRVLYDYARVVPADQAIVEIGAYHGKSTAYLALAAREGGGQTVITVDTWSEDNSEWRSAVKAQIPSPTFEKFMEQLTWIGLIDQVEPHEGESAPTGLEYEQALKDGDVQPVGLLYVDGDHSYEAVMADFDAWRNCMASDGVIIFDDYTRTNPGVIKALRELRDTGRIVPKAIEAGRLIPAYVGEEA
jgi:predicted O-methyltransferase YrrM